ncbi:MAG: phosphoglycerate dehydrogenase [Dehalococcoidia bacterium]|nr:MAG: phosphoglycerate dehydrogenase [Dehalococcoidia bacterium]
MKMNVLVADPLAQEGIDILKQYANVDVKTKLKPEEIKAIIGNYEALIVRSQTRVTADIIEAGTKLIVIGRAGVGVDNIDTQAATKRGIIVVNAPTGNTISAAEHAVALMLSLARNIPQANTSLKNCEWKRNEFMGTEVRGKTLGIVGLGNVGSEVARRAQGLEMKLIGYDPFVTAERAKKMSVDMKTLDEIWKEADFITLHVPLIESTRNLIGAKQLAMMKPTARIINAARGGLIDEEALVAAINAGKLGGAAVDVFVEEPCTKSILFGCSKIIVTPHLGASTNEAQTLAATEVVQQIIDVFNGQPAKYAVNAPLVSAEVLPVLVPYMRLANSVGNLMSYLGEGQIKSIHIKYQGEVAAYDSNALKAVLLGSLLGRLTAERINMVNATMEATKRGIRVSEEKQATCDNYANLITLEAVTSEGTATVSGSVMRDESHIVQVNQFWIDIVPTGGYFLFCDHRDRPGLIGAVGNITGSADINISYMHLSRLKPRGEALMILALDEPLPEAARKEILALKDVYTAKVVKI